MGTDFLKKTEKSYKRQWSRGVEALSQPDLFVENPQLKRRTFLMHPVPGASIKAGDEYLARVEGDRVVAERGNERVGELRSVTGEEIGKLRDSGGYGKLTVERTMPVSGAADVTLR